MKIKQVTVQKLEVGDIWESDEEILYIYETNEANIRAIGKLKRNRNPLIFAEVFYASNERFLKFTELYKYVGKAKGSIEDLFIEEK